MAHWYDSTGKTHFEIENAAAVKRGDDITTRPTTLRDAKKHGWFPGWTAIGGILDKPALNKWKLGIFQGVIDEHLSKQDSETLGERNDRLLSETRDEFWRRVHAEERHELEKYAELGTAVHKRIEYEMTHEQNETNAYYHNKDKAIEKTVRGCVKAYWEWYYGAVDYKDHSGDNITEQTFCSPEWGYGGTIDLQYLNKEGKYCIVDFKTKQTKPGEKIVLYPENKWQLVAYALGIGKVILKIWPDFGGLQCDFNPDNWKLPILGNLYLSTTEPGRWEYIELDPKEIPELILDVRDLTRLWRRMNGFTGEK